MHESSRIDIASCQPLLNSIVVWLRVWRWYLLMLHSSGACCHAWKHLFQDFVLWFLMNGIWCLRESCSIKSISALTKINYGFWVKIEVGYEGAYAVLRTVWNFLPLAFIRKAVLVWIWGEAVSFSHFFHTNHESCAASHFSSVTSVPIYLPMSQTWTGWSHIKENIRRARHMQRGGGPLESTAPERNFHRCRRQC